MDGSTSNNRNSSRKRPAVNPHNNDCTDDPVIGLNVGGRKFYTHQSTLTNGSAYFAARFSGNFGTDSITDEDGRDVYLLMQVLTCLSTSYTSYGEAFHPGLKICIRKTPISTKILSMKQNILAWSLC